CFFWNHYFGVTILEIVVLGIVILGRKVVVVEVKIRNQSS
ncbi:2397_t:CDS:1, partial [Gigaspora margarita]